jgi:hypothetical protein
LPEPWALVFYEESDGRVPGRDFLAECPTTVRAMMFAVLRAVQDAPPPQFSGGGKWEAMHEAMTGYFEVRHRGKQAGGPVLNHRLFCLLDREAPGLPGPVVAVVDGRSKPPRTAMRDEDYAAVRRLGSTYLASRPRRIAVRYRPGDPVPTAGTYFCDEVATRPRHRLAARVGSRFPPLPGGCAGEEWRPEYRPQK